MAEVNIKAIYKIINILRVKTDNVGLIKKIYIKLKPKPTYPILSHINIPKTFCSIQITAN